MKQLILYVAMLVFLHGCTTTRPLTKQEIVENARRDTLLMKQTILNQPVRIVEVATIRHDTLVIERNNKTETLIPVTDTVMLATYLQRYRADQDQMVEGLRTMISNLQLIVLKSHSNDTERSRIQTQLDTTKKEANQARETLATNYRVIYEVPKYIYFALVALVVILFVIYLYLKRKLLHKQRQSQ